MAICLVSYKSAPSSSMGSHNRRVFRNMWVLRFADVIFSFLPCRQVPPVRRKPGRVPGAAGHPELQRREHRRPVNLEPRRRGGQREREHEGVGRLRQYGRYGWFGHGISPPRMGRVEAAICLNNGSDWGCELSRRLGAISGRSSRSLRIAWKCNRCY